MEKVDHKLTYRLFMVAVSVGLLVGIAAIFVANKRSVASEVPEFPQAEERVIE